MGIVPTSMSLQEAAITSRSVGGKATVWAGSTGGEVDIRLRGLFPRVPLQLRAGVQSDLEAALMGAGREP